MNVVTLSFLFKGSMFMMVRVDMSRFPQFKTDLEFVEDLVSEQSVFCLPGQCFNYPNSMRLVLTLPLEMFQEACQRILEFCRRAADNRVDP
jgi:tyrosine aminotransferase